ncbi:hypothetical protein MRX96_055288 [Rhipicephalus microplus]
MTTTSASDQSSVSWVPFSGRHACLIDSPDTRLALEWTVASTVTALAYYYAAEGAVEMSLCSGLPLRFLTPRRRAFGTADCIDWTTTNPANAAALSADDFPNLTDLAVKTNVI